VFCGFDRASVAHPLDGFGFLVPAVEGRDILGTIFSSSLFERRSPEGKVALTTFVGGVRRPELVDLEDGALVDYAVGELGRVVGAKGAPEFVHVQKWARAIPQYVIGHDRVGAAIERLENQYPKLFFCTNYQGGVSVGDCVEHAAKACERVVSRMSLTHETSFRSIKS